MRPPSLVDLALARREQEIATARARTLAADKGTHRSRPNMVPCPVPGCRLSMRKNNSVGVCADCREHPDRVERWGHTRSE